MSTITLHSHSDPPVYLDSFGHALGEAVPVAEAPGLTGAERDQLTAAGLRTFRKAGEPVWSLAATSIANTLRDVSADRLRAVVIASGRLDLETSSGFQEILVADPRLADLPLFGVGLNACASGGNAFAVAVSLLRRFPSGSVLLVAADTATTDRERLWTNGRAILSDAAASCLVSHAPMDGGYRLLGCTQTNRLALGLPEPPERKGARVREQLRMIGVTAAATCAAGGLTTAEVTDFVTNNLAPSIMDLHHQACAIPQATLHAELVPELGHCFSADILLGLENLLARGSCTADRVLAMWGSYTSWTGIAVQGPERQPGYSSGSRVPGAGA
ncbi:hypothetical protein [Actinokineospora enzanensis]|uniref:hypothetical protein n=1 Tax=Actinokineospora enzanensis TaxID=155975 RepID=UPI00037F4568|nr:hypothetical protein [Actinokineospora enzanensis]